MGYRFLIHTAASDQLAALPADVDERIRSKLEEMVTNEFRDLLDYDVKRVAGVDPDIYRARVGDYRVFFLLEEPVVAILHVDQREGAYQNPGRLEDRAEDFG